MKQKEFFIIFEGLSLKQIKIFFGRWESNFKISQYSSLGTPLLKKTPTQVISCEYCEIFKNTYFEEHLCTAAFFSIFF